MDRRPATVLEIPVRDRFVQSETHRVPHEYIRSENQTPIKFENDDDLSDVIPDRMVKFQSEIRGPVGDDSPSKSPMKCATDVAPNPKRKPSHVSPFQTYEELPLMWKFEEEKLPHFPTETQDLRILVVTWNMHGKKPKESLEKLFHTEKVKHHLISIGTEECLRSIPLSTVYESKSYWVNFLRLHLDSEYLMVKSRSMNALHLTLFAHRSILSHIKGIESADIRTGLGNLVGNKGAIGISLSIFNSSFLFLNCHLSSGQNQAKRRNEDFERIFNDIELPKARVAQEKKLKMKTNIVDRFDFVLWSGDFNYRVNQTRDSTIAYIKNNNYKVLLEQDQLNIEKKENRTISLFNEGEISFGPTYKYQPDTDLFDVVKKRTPSWTDRILYCSKSKPHNIQQLNYQSVTAVKLSDHRPVVSQFVIKVEKLQKDTPRRSIKIKTSFCNIF